MLAETLGAELSIGKIQFYFELLTDLEMSDLKKALNLIANTGKFFPKPVEIREVIQGKPEDKAVVAVEKIQGALRGVGGYQSVIFDDPIIHVVIQNYGGWAKLSDITSEEWKWVKKDFEKAYRIYVNRASSLAQIPATLPGIHETINSAKGMPWPEEKAVMIGDEQKALKWTEHKKALTDGNTKAKVLPFSNWTKV